MALQRAIDQRAIDWGDEATAMAFPRVFEVPLPWLGVAYLAGYVLLDWVSFVHTLTPYGITPWNPPVGLNFVFVLLFGRRLIPLLFAAPLLADLIVRHLPFAWPIEIAVTGIYGGVYALALVYLLRPATRFNPSLASMRDLLLLLGVAAASAAAASASFALLLGACGLLATQDLVSAVVRLWVGDMIGISVVAPFALILLTRGRMALPSREGAAQLVAIVLALALVFASAREQQFQLFYVLFLPIVWMAVRSGLEGVTTGLLLTQLGLMVGVQTMNTNTADFTAFQAMMVVLTLTGLAAGALVAERQRTELQLRLHQDSLARLARLGSMGEFAAAVAHEINQPLTAAGTYTRLVASSLSAGAVPDPEIEGAASKAAAQVERAAAVLRRLRALIRLDQSNRAPAQVEHIVRETLDLCQPDLARANIAVEVTIAPALPTVIVDVLQLEQALINVVRNAIEAIAEARLSGQPARETRAAGGERGTITIAATSPEPATVEITVSDTGRGFAPGLLAPQPPPLASTKPDGLGIGLSLARTIVEAHGGKVVIGGSTRGAVVTFILPVAGAAAGGPGG